ncbi:MAG: hypothetical protein V1872_03145 [bacterium]
MADSSIHTKFYQYIDEKGNICLTNNINNIPQQYHSKVKKIEFSDNTIYRKSLGKRDKTKKITNKIEAIKITPNNYLNIDHKKFLSSILNNQAKTISVILLSVLIGYLILSFIIKKTFKSFFLRILVKIILLAFIAAGLSTLYFSYLGSQLSQIMPSLSLEGKTFYTPSDIINQTKKVMKQVEINLQKRQRMFKKID